MSIVLSSNKSDFKYNFNPSIKLDTNKINEIALLNIDMYHSVPNIDESNNEFMYEYNDVVFIKKIPTGAYEIEAINEYIQELLVEHDNKDIFSIEANLMTLKCIINMKKPGVKFYLNHIHSLNKLLGFNKSIIEGVGKHEGDNIVDILSVNSILINCDIVEGSYLNGLQKPILYSFFPDVPPGYKINEKPNTLVYLPVTIPTINSVHIWLTDQDHKPLNLRGEKITIRLHLKSI